MPKVTKAKPTDSTKTTDGAKKGNWQDEIAPPGSEITGQKELPDWDPWEDDGSKAQPGEG